MNLYVVANDVEHFNKLNQLPLKSIIVSSKYSTYRTPFTIDEIKTCFETNPNLFVSLYDLISETNINEVIAYLNELMEIGVQNFIVNDSGLVYYLQDYNVNVILDNVTLNSCSTSINMWKQFNVFGCVCGREITLDEINDICDNAIVDIFVHIQGSFPIFTSIRKLLTNYQHAKDVKHLSDDVSLYDKERNNTYKIIEKDSGVVMFSSYEQCSIDDIDNLKTVNFIIDQPNVSSQTNLEIVKCYLDYQNYSISDIQKLSSLKQSRGFFYKRTLYKL